jgi:hypothetical protein
MLAERNVLITLLRLSKDGNTNILNLSKEAQVSVSVVKEVLKRNSHLISFDLSRNEIEIGLEERLGLAIHAIKLGADIERVCRSLTWAEFENLSVLAFEANNFNVKKHFRFSFTNRRWEIDILGLKKPIVACVDCKHWYRSWRGAGSRKAAEMQLDRTKALAEASKGMTEKIGIIGWRYAHFVPIILSLVPGAQKFHNRVPIVPVLQLKDFLPHLPAYVQRIAHSRREYVFT